MIEFEKALQIFLDEYLALCEKLHTNQQEKMLLDKNSPYNVLKQALTEFKAAKKVNSGEALECLERIENNILYLLSDCDVDVETDTNFLSLKEHKSCEKIRNYILKAQEQEKENTEYKKTLEIIKEKCVNIWFLMSSHTVIDYNTRIKELDDSDKFVLTKEEFVLLKKYFN